MIGESPSYTGAIAEAAALLGHARRPAIGGLGCDVDGVRAALRLGARIGAMVDHAARAHERIELRALADGGVMVTSLTEARHRGDLIVLVGSGAVAYADHGSAFADAGGLYPWRGARSLLCLATGEARPNHVAAEGGVSELGTDIPIGRLLGLLKARLAARPVTLAGNHPTVAAIDDAVARLKAARFGVIVYDPADLDHVEADLLQGLVKALNVDTRFTTLAVPAHHHGRGANLVAAWNTGGHLPVGLGRGYPDQDDWRCDVARALADGEVDGLLWIGALGPDLPAAAAGVPTVALLHHGAAASTATVTIEVGVPGVTHAGVLADALHGGFSYLEARAPQPLPTVAAVVDAIAAAIEGAAR